MLSKADARVSTRPGGSAAGEGVVRTMTAWLGSGYGNIGECAEGFCEKKEARGIVSGLMTIIGTSAVRSD